LFRNYLEDPDLGGRSAHQSQRLFTLYFALFAAGRLAASWIQKRMHPAAHLGLNLAAAILCLLFVTLSSGMTAVLAVTLLGFFVSIFFPTLYSLAIQGMGEKTGQASGLLTMGFVGCAIIPVLQGRLADTIGLQHSYVLGFAAYAVAGLFALRCYRARRNVAVAV
jgi:FHS family L-fucose permease-like MFS transporter